MKKTFTKQFEWVMGMTGSTSCFSPTRRLLLLLCLILVGVGGTKAQSDVTFNDGVRYSQWVIDSRMNNFYANTTPCGFAVYNQNGTQTSARVDGKTKLDYVVGLVAKSIIEASQYYSQFTWAESFAKPWFLSIQNYGDNFYSKFSTSGGSLDDLNAVKLFIPLRAMTATDGKYPNTKTYGYTTSALDNAITGLNAHNTNYRIKDNNILAKTAGNDVIGGWWHKSTYENQMWLDGAYMGPALFAELVNYSGTTKNIDSSNDWDLIVKQFTILHEMCWNETDKLPYHAFAADGGTNSTSHSDTWAGLSSKSPYVFHSASYWGRAVGWYFLALVDILEQMEKANIPSTDSKFTTLKGYLEETAAGIKARQDQTTGGWYQILDENNEFSASSYNNGKSHTTTYNYIESSATALFTAAYLKAIRLGYLAENDYKTVAVNGYKCLVNNFFSVDENGKVNIFGSCRSAGLGGSGDNYKAGKERYRDGSKEYYLLGYDVAKVEKNENKTEGKVLGAFIMAATEYERLYQSSMLLSKDLNKTYNLSSNESLSVEVLGDGTPAYQWYDANTSNPIEGATNASYTPTKSGKYYCKITVTPPSSPAAKIRAASTSGSYTITTSTANVTVESTGTETGGTGTSNDIFSLTVTYNKNYNLSSGADLNLTSDYATVTGGSALVHNGKSSAVDIIYLKNGSGNIALNGSSSSTYAKLTLNNPLQEGDVITFTSDESSIGSFYLTTTSTRNTNCSVNDGTYTVTSSDGLVNSTVLYVWSNSKGKFKSITITRTGSSITISKQPKSTDYVTGATVTPLTVVATLDGYTLSYQWYENNTNSNTGGTEISGATAESYTPTLPSTAGTTYYYCIVTATNGTETLTATSDVAAITVKDKTYTVTYNMNGHGTQIDPASDLTALPNQLPKPTADGYTFVGWYTDEPLTQEATPGDELTDDVTLYAKWTPITDLFTLTGVTSTTVSVGSKNTVAVSSEKATITGGSADLYNGHSSAKDMILNSQINLNGSSSSYLKITLGNSLKVGDEIIINPAASSFILKATASTSTTNAKSFTGSYVIQQGDAVVGKNEIYLYKGSNSLIGDINITRYYPESDSRATFTYGSSQLTFTETTEGTYTTTLEIGASKKGETITITPTAQEGASIKEGNTPVASTITITAPSTTGNTEAHTYTVTSKDGSSTTTYIINVKVVKEKITLKYSDSNGNTEWTWNSTTTPTIPTFDQPTVKAYIKNAAGVDELLEDGSLSYTYVSDVTSVATVDASSGVITIAESGNGGAKIYATLKENENYYADPAFFNVLLEQGYSFSVDANKTAPAINTSKYITRTTEGTEEKLVKMTFGGWKWEGYANKDATTKTLGSYKVVRGDKTTYYTDKWNDSGVKASDIASIDGHYYSWNGVNDAVDESKAASDKAIYGSIRYGWFKSPVHDNDGKTTVSYPYTLPVRGSFMTFEPTMNGTLTIYILQNGAWNTNDDGGTYEQVGDGSITYEKGDIIPGQFRPHAFQVVNQRGLTVQEFSPNYSVSTKQKVDSRYYCMFKEDEDYNQTKYNNPYNVAKWTEFAQYMSTEEQKRAHDSWNSGPLGAQKIIELDNGSFLAVQKGIVKYTFHVTGNETYYFFSNFSKMGFSGANFVPDVSQPQETVSDKISTLDLSDVKAYNKITAKENGKIEGTNLKDYTYSINGKDIAPVAGVTIPQFYSITLTRTFKPNQWTTLTLPFNLTEEEVQRIFGAGTQLIQLNNATVDNGCAKLEFIYHEIQNVLPGHPYLIKPTGVEVDETNDATASVDKDGDGNITAFTVYSKCVNPFINQVEIDCDAYTFKGVTGYSTANVTSSTNNNWSVKFEENDIFVSDGNGKMYVSAGSSYGKGYRAWFKKKVDPASGGKINSISLEIDNPGDDDDNVVTTIDMVDVDPDVFNALGIATGVYNLNGQKVSDDMRSLPKGIYIVNGKKIVRK